MLDLDGIKARIVKAKTRCGSAQRKAIHDLAQIDAQSLVSEVERLRAELHAAVDAKLALSFRMDSIAATLCVSTKDWCRNRPDAWIYAIAVGWGDQIEEVAAIHRWESFEVDRLCKMQPNNVRRAADRKESP